MGIYRPEIDEGTPVVEDYGYGDQAAAAQDQDESKDALVVNTGRHSQHGVLNKPIHNHNHGQQQYGHNGGDNHNHNHNPANVARPVQRRSSIIEHPRLTLLNRTRLLCGDVVNHPKVQMIIIVLIIINATMMGLATFDFVTENEEIDEAFEKTDTVFLWVFSIELGMQIIYRGYTLFMDGWLVFDFVIIVLSWSFSQLQIIRAFRIFRALRIITRIETMRNLVTALFDIMPRLGAITTLLVLIFYIFAVLFTQLFGELELSGDYFDVLHHSVLTLFVMMTMEWADVARECMAQVWWAWAPFVSFIMITGFIVFNLIIAVVCDAVAVIENKDDLEPDLWGSGFVGMMSKSVDGDGSEGMMSREHGGGGGGGGIGMTATTHEEDMVEILAERISVVLNSQKEMLATLESLTKDSFDPTQLPGKQMLVREEEAE